MMQLLTTIILLKKTYDAWSPELFQVAFNIQSFPLVSYWDHLFTGTHPGVRAALLSCFYLKIFSFQESWRTLNQKSIACLYIKKSNTNKIAIQIFLLCILYTIDIKKYTCVNKNNAFFLCVLWHHCSCLLPQGLILLSWRGGMYSSHSITHAFAYLTLYNRSDLYTRVLYIFVERAQLAHLILLQSFVSL